MSSILSAFSPRSKERPEEMAGEGEIDLLIGTDCISEGQNLQDCDFLVNYDIHWNPVRIIQRFGRIDRIGRSEEHTSELQSLMRISYAVFCMKKKNQKHKIKPSSYLFRL